MALLTPIGRPLLPKPALKSANLGVQIYGGHGFIREWGMEQIVRDARISMLYMRAPPAFRLDLLGRKVIGSGGKLLLGFTALIDEFCAPTNPEDAEFIQRAQGLQG